MGCPAAPALVKDFDPRRYLTAIRAPTLVVLVERDPGLAPE